MFLSQWVLRVGQVIAPDQKYYTEKDDDKESDSFWNDLAPDPNFTSSSAENSASVHFQSQTPRLLEEDRLPQMPSSQESSLRRPGQNSGASKTMDSFVPCDTCVKALCSSCYQNAIRVRSTTNDQFQSNLPSSTPYSTSPIPSGSKLLSALQSPRVPGHDLVDSLVEDKVLAAAKKHAETMASPTGTGAGQLEANVFRWCSISTAIPDKLQKTLRKTLRSNRHLLTARSYSLNVSCPDGYTIFMAAAYGNNMKALEIIWEVVETLEVDKRDVLEDRNLQGKSALHIAMEQGHLEASQFINGKYIDVFGISAEAPGDLLGRTPLGLALLSPEANAKRNRSEMMKHLYQHKDKSIVGRQLPVAHRVVLSANNGESSKGTLRALAGMSEMPGKRVLMEDSIACQGFPSGLVLAVCDGHGDLGHVSRFVADRLVKDTETHIASQLKSAEVWEDALREICVQIDRDLLSTKRKGGSVAVLAAVTASSVVVANVGDCRCILVQYQSERSTQELVSCTSDDDWDTVYRVMPLSIDHKPSIREEADRIVRSGLQVIEERFIEDGNEVLLHKVMLSDDDVLACSRAFGDFEYKANQDLGPEGQAVVAVPDVVVHERCDKDALIILACDGVWDVMSNEDVAKFATKRMEFYYSLGDDVTGSLLPTIGDELLEHCLHRGSTDNLSVVVAALSSVADRILSSAADSVLPPKALDFA